MIEILAPCGGLESLSAALNTGADAIYLGLKDFSARKNAENFSFESLESVCREAHRRGVKVYLTMNTLIYDEEIVEFSETVKKAAEYGIDAVIVQDLGAAEIVKTVCPKLPIHASTQMSINSLSGVKMAEELGFSRVVLGRELSFEQIKEISENSDIELEVFVHGALCVSISGQCYMSSVFGGRSGNRGQCAQPCRLNFKSGERENILSLKDNGLIEHIKELEEIGVASAKIEGRMKRPEYVACAVNAAKSASLGEETDKENLCSIFSRSGVTDGYFKDVYEHMQGIRTKEDVIASTQAITGMKQLYHKEKKRFDCEIFATVHENEPIELMIKCGKDYVTISGSIPQKAISKEITAESVCEQVSKLGGTIFGVSDVDAEVDGGLSVPASEFNRLRREAVSALEEKITARNTPHYTFGELHEISKPKRRVKPKIRIEVQTADQLSQALSLSEFEYIYAPMSLVGAETPQKERIILVPPMWLGDCEKQTAEKLKVLKKCGFERVLCHSIGHTLLAEECGLIPHGGFRMNITNTYAQDFCESLGLYDTTLSFEPTLAQLHEIKSNIPVGIIAYGHLPLMTTRRCPINDGKPCNTPEKCGKKIIDRQGNELSVICSNTVEILNPDVLILSDRMKNLEGFDFITLRLTLEKNAASILDMYLNDIKPEGSLTRGLYFRGAV